MSTTVTDLVPRAATDQVIVQTLEAKLHDEGRRLVQADQQEGEAVACRKDRVRR